MDLADLDGRLFTLWLTDEADESAVFSGIARWDGQTLAIERTGNLRFEVRPEWYERIQPVGNEQARKILLGGEYFLRLRVGNDPPADGEGEFEQTGLKWPQ
jgi:hypothetical protein